MRLRSLIHVAEAVVALGQSRQVIVLGSSALLGCFPELGEPGGPLETTCDADLLPDPITPQIAAYLLEAMGENSLFHEAQGYHADFLDPGIGENLPPGWKERLIGLTEKVACIEPYDLAANKLLTGRGKDLRLVRTLLQIGKIQEAELRDRIASWPLPER